MGNRSKTRISTTDCATRGGKRLDSPGKQGSRRGLRSDQYRQVSKCQQRYPHSFHLPEPTTEELWGILGLLWAGADGAVQQGMAPFIIDDDLQQNARQAAHVLGHATHGVNVSVNMAVWPSEAAQDSTCGTGSVEAAQQSGSGEDISVALEWKLLFPLLAAGHEDPRPDDKRRIVEALCEDNKEACLEQGHDCVAQVIREAGENAVTAHSLLKGRIDERELWGSGWVVKKANSAVPLSEEKAVKGCIWVPVEICSPKMPLKDPETGVRMRKVLDKLSSTYRLAANCSCEVHVHLGQMNGQAWSLPALKRLGTLLWVAEPTLRSIRDPRSPNAANTYTWGFAMREHSRLAEKVCGSATAPRELGAVLDQQIFNNMAGGTTNTPANELSAVAEIWKTTSHLELGQLLSGSDKKHRRLGFNFSAFGEEDERAKRNPRTMEFRMMEGSVEADLVMGWMGICGTIAEVAVAESDARYAAAIDLLLRRFGGISHSEEAELGETLGDRRGREFRELMQALGVSEGIYQGFEDKISREHSSEV